MRAQKNIKKTLATLLRSLYVVAMQSDEPIATTQRKAGAMKTKYGSTLLTVENAKTTKGEALGYLTGILYLSPARESVPYGGGNLCPMASNACSDECIYTTGRGRFDAIKAARMAKTLYFFKNRDAFMKDLEASIIALERKAKRAGLIPAVRLNGTSDYPFFRLPIMDRFRHIQFYNYTKVHTRMMDYLSGKLPPNEYLTFSRSEINDEACKEVLARGGNVAAVFSTKKGAELPREYLGHKVIDGDAHDLRFLDHKNVIVGLRAKGKARNDRTGFVVQVGI